MSRLGITRAARAGTMGVLALCLVSGCGSSTPAATHTSETDVAATTPATTAAAAPASFSPGRSYKWGLKSADGLTVALEVEFGALVPARDAAAELPSEFAAQEASCAVDAERDGLLPIRLRVTNTTDGFSVSPTIELRHDGRDYGVIEIGATYSDGPSCAVWEVTKLLQWEDIGSVEDRTADWLLVLKDFYSPEWPRGDFDTFGEHSVHLAAFEGDLAQGNRLDPFCVGGTTELAWTGDWRSMLQSHFPILDSGTGFGEPADDPLEEC